MPSRCSATPPAAPSGSPSSAFTLPGTRRLGCLLVHGLTATPDEMRFLGDALARRGFPVRAVQLAGHGTRVEDLIGTRWTDWFASVTDGLDALAADVDQVALVGMSMGALLSLHCAATRPDAVTGLVLCGTPLHLTDARLRWLPLVARVRGAEWRAQLLPKPNGPDIADPVVRAASRSYSAMPLAAVLELLRLRAAVRGELRRVTQPVLLLHGRNDHSVPVANLELLSRKLGSRQVETHVLEHSWHVVTVDYDREEVARLAIAFLDRLDGTVAASARPKVDSPRA